MPKTIFYNVQHAPIGAFASFTLGCKGAKGGLGLALGRPAEESLYIGVQSRDGRRYEALPFFAGAGDDRRRYTLENPGSERMTRGVTVFRDAAIRRDFSLGVDAWQAGDLALKIFSPVFPAPDPDAASLRDMQRAYVPAVLVEITVDNRDGDRSRRMFFGYSGSDPYSRMRRLDDTAHGRLAGVGVGLRTAICSRSPGVSSGLGFSIGEALSPVQPENLACMLGGVGVLFADVPPGRRSVFRFAVCFHHGGTATTGIEAAYLYTRWFADIESVAAFSLRNFDAIRQASQAFVRRLPLAHLSPDQRFMLAHAVQSYYGSTQLLDAGKPFWVVNEGEYRMMNTFDLTADHAFFELRMNPWTLRNALEWYAERYAYRDRVAFPGGRETFPGGISFTHDMGVANNFSPPGRSAYEQFGLDGCFSHMTHEQLVNWACCATTYVSRVGDRHWFQRHERRMRAVFESLCRRDHPDAAQRDGVMDLDSSRCRGGSEITTYDSLDASLGQARRNLYLAVKTWAAYVGLATCFEAHALPKPAARMWAQAHRAADTIAAAAGADGQIPAILEPGVESRILSAIEGLAFPWFAGHGALVREDGPFGHLILALKRHLQSVLKPGVCLFDDGAWKLSSTSDNSWLSKIYLCQFVAREILGMTGTRMRVAMRRADAAHVRWLLHPDCRYWAWSDQIVAGKVRGSKYYPRGVTAILWTLESEASAAE